MKIMTFNLGGTQQGVPLSAASISGGKEGENSRALLSYLGNFIMNITREDAKKSVGPGWGSLIDKIYDFLPESSFVLQVKEKYGTLRFYVDTDEKILDKIEEIEKESEKICEICGKEGLLRTDLGWWLTLCDEDYKERKKNG